MFKNLHDVFEHPDQSLQQRYSALSYNPTVSKIVNFGSSVNNNATKNKKKQYTFLEVTTSSLHPSPKDINRRGLSASLT